MKNIAILLTGFALGFAFCRAGVLTLARAWVGVVLGKWRAKIAAKIGGKP